MVKVRPLGKSKLHTVLHQLLVPVAEALQSTHLRRGRHDTPITCGCCGGAAIHAPAQGATRSTNYLRLLWRRYNPRSRAGSDTIHQLLAAVAEALQSTHLRRGRHDPPITCGCCGGAAIHAPAQGATRSTNYLRLLRRRCNSRSRAGSDTIHQLLAAVVEALPPCAALRKV